MKFIHPTKNVGRTGFTFNSRYPYTPYFIIRGLAGKKHQGWDIICATGTRVAAPGKMQQYKTGYSLSYGNYVFARSLEKETYGLEFRFAHLSAIAWPREGKIVKRGEVFGWSGNTGVSTNPHLHFETLKDGVKVDYQPYF